MLRKWNRMLAFILAFALVTTTFSSDYASAKVYAVGDASELDENIDESGDDVQELEWDDIDNESDGDDNYDEPSDDDYDVPSDDESNDESDDASEGAGDEANTDATNDGETPLDETPSEEVEDAADAATSASTEEEAVAAASASSSEEVIVKEEVNMPAQSFYDSDGGMRVSVEADEGAFPEETTMTVSAISDDEAMDAAIDALGDKVKQAKGVNITFKDKDGNEIEPADAGKVHVTIKLVTSLEGDSFSVVHKDDEGNAEKVAGASAEGATFTADSFSVYILASEDDEEALLRMVETYIFKVYNNETDSWEVVNEQSVKNGETLNNPGIPTLGENQEFFGWFIEGTDDQPEFGLKNDITSTREVIVKAKIQSTYYVTLIGVDEEVVQVLHKTVENDEEAMITVNVSVTPKKDTQAFVGWKNKADVTYDYGAEVDAKNENNRTLTAQVVDAYWIHFHENDGGTGGGASYTPPVFVTSKTNYVATKPKNPTRSGYEFTGWFLDSECEQPFDWSQSIDSDQELYAGWKKGKASFTVVIWKQSIEDDRDAVNDAKTYDYESSFVVSNYNAGAEITNSMLGDALTRTYEGFTYRTYEVENSDTGVGEKEISPKGTTIVNVRYDRKLITYKFYTCSITQNGFNAGTVTNITEYADCKEMHGLYGQTIDKYGYTWPSTREWHEGKTVKYQNRRYVLAGSGMTFLAEFSLTADQDFYSNENETGSHYYRHYKQNVDGVTYPSNNNPTNTAKVDDDTTITFTFSNKYDGFTVDKYSTDGRNWNNIPASGNVQIYNEDLYIRYKRNSYKLTIASVLEPTDLATDQPNDTTPHVEKDDISVLYGAALSGQKNSSESFAKTVAAPDGYVAKETEDGGILWADPTGSVPFNWDQTMPANNNTRAYIVWTKNRFVFNLDLNVDNDKNPDTTVGYDTVEIKNGQRTSWKPYYGADGANKDAIMKNFVREGYVLAGWFNYADDNPYDYGKVTGNVNLYAKWRRVGGVNIVYDATPGTLDDENRDGATYASDSTVVVTSPAKPVTGFTFVGWQLLKNDDSVVATFYPNSSFVIDDSYIRTKTEGEETINYVVLKALYVETGTIDDIYTKVVYDANGGEGGSVTVTEVKGADGTMHKIRVNEAITAWSAAEALSNGFKRNGWELIGWNIDKTAATQGEVKIALGKEYIIADNENNEGNPSTNTLYAVWKQKKATYIVKYYKGSVATANEIPSNIAPAQANVGDNVTLSNDIVQAYKPAKGYGDGSQVDAPYTMDVEQYDNDGNVVPQVINVVYPPVKVTVTIKGNSDTKDYTGEEQSVTGYEVVSISDTSYTEDDFDLAEGVEAKASGTNAGTYKMNLDSDSFVNTNTDFTDVTFVVTDGQLVIKKITTKVTIKGDVKTNDYDGEEHVAKGYTVTSTNPKFTADDVEFTPGDEIELDGKDPVAKRTDAGETPMGLTADMFKSTNDNFENVTFEVKDGSQTIKKISAKVTIVGNNNTAAYDKEEHKVTGYKVTISNPLYTENDFTFTSAAGMDIEEGKPVARRTDVGTTDMGLAEEQFSNISGNFENVEFDVTDGYQAITAADEVTVTITGNNNTADYDGEEHSVAGYTVSISNPLYTENDFDFVPAEGMELDNNGKPVAKGTDAGTYNMGLAVGQFVNNSNNFEKVTFEVNDGYQTISPITATVTITGANNESEYDGEEHSVAGYEVEISNDLYTKEDFKFTPADDMTIEDGKPVAKRTDAGTTQMGLAIAQFKNNNANFENVEFIVNDGYQTITPINVEVTITGATEEAKYDGEEHVAIGYTFSPSTALYTEEDFTYTAEEGMTLVGGEPAAKRTEAGKTSIGLKPGQFANANTKNFSEVKFNVTDGYVNITKADKVTVTITGHTDEFDYNGEKRTVSGYEKAADSELFDLTKVEFDGTASVSETNAGTYPMGLTEDMFSATDDNFEEIAFEIVDGELKINKITTTVTITGNHDSTPYDGEEHSVSGFTAEAESSLYDAEEDVAYTGTDEPSAERTDAGKTLMGLTSDDFENTNENFENVTFVIVDGYQEITKINATVVIKGAQNTATFDNTEHTVKGYEVESISTDLYTEDDIEFVKAGEVEVDENGEPIATRKIAGKTDMKLTADNFKNTSDNFDVVTFTVTDGYQEIVPVDEVKVKITGAQNTTDYDGTEHSVWGYTYESSSELYTDEYFTFTAGSNVVLDQDSRPSATRTDAGKTIMGLAADMFKNTNENFAKVTFEVEDGYQEITPISATVTIVGNKKTLAYNGKEQKVEGYEVTNISTNLYTEEDFTFSGPKNVKRTDVGSTSMGLLEEHFANTNDNFDNVKFEITDGEIKISPLAIKVSIIGNKDKKEFNGSEQNITGYKATFNDTVVASPEGNSAETYTLTADAVENIYKEEYIVFDYNGDGVADTKNDAIAKGTVKGEYPMNLAKTQFTNSNENFEVEFEVEDGLLEIISREKPYSLVIKSADVHTPYNGTRQSYTILAGVGVEDSENPVQATINAILNKIASFFGITASAEDGDVTFTCEGVEYVLKGAKVNSSGTEVGEYAFEFIGEPEVMLGEEPVTENFDIKYELGKLVIDKAEVTITVNSFTKAQNTADPQFTGTITGLQGDDTLNLEYIRVVGGEAPGTYAITPNMTKEELEMEYTNYTFTIIPGVLTITGGGGGDEPGDPTPIPDDPTPAAPTPTPAPVQAVLGARREEPVNGQAVLGARRARTEDTTDNTSRVFAIVIAAAVVASLVFTKKRKEEQE